MEQPAVFGSNSTPEGAETWELSARPCRIGPTHGFGMYLRAGCRWFICTEAIGVRPVLFTEQWALDSCKTVRSVLDQLALSGSCVGGEAFGSNGQSSVHLGVKCSATVSFRFTMMNEEPGGKESTWSTINRKFALCVLGDVMDILSGGRLNWGNMMIPAEPTEMPDA